MIIGRSQRCDLHIDDDSVSGTHARLDYRGEKFWLVDLGSTNGTFINEKRIRESTLADGDKIRFGTRKYVFEGGSIIPHSTHVVAGTPPSFINAKQPQAQRKVLLGVFASAAAIGLILIGLLVFGADKMDIATTTARSTVMVLVLDGNEEPCSWGSGFLVQDRNTVATNHHVIESVVGDVEGESDCKTVVVGISDSSGLRIETFEPAEVIAFDADADLALIEVQSDLPIAIRPLELSQSEPRLGDEIRIFGYPAIGGSTLTVTDGFLGGLDESGGSPLYKTTSQIAQGNSGGPVIDSKGKVLGIATARFVNVEESESLGLITPARYLAELLENN